MTSITLYGNGALGVCGRRSSVALSVFFSVSGMLLPAWVQVPAASVPVGVQLALELAQDLLHLERQRRLVERDRVDLQPLGPLVGAVHLRHQLAVGGLAQVDHDPQAQAGADAQLPFPDLLGARPSWGRESAFSFS